MSYITGIFERAHIQHIREFLINGVECINISDKPYKQRLEESSKSAMDMIQAKFPDMNEYDKITAEIYKYVGTVEDVYMEIGLQCGMALAIQFLKELKK
jgi:galactitol-specific phosphotransferase system IIC component